MLRVTKIGIPFVVSTISKTDWVGYLEAYVNYSKAHSGLIPMHLLLGFIKLDRPCTYSQVAGTTSVLQVASLFLGNSSPSVPFLKKYSSYGPMLWDILLLYLLHHCFSLSLSRLLFPSLLFTSFFLCFLSLRLLILHYFPISFSLSLSSFLFHLFICLCLWFSLIFIYFLHFSY